MKYYTSAIVVLVGGICLSPGTEGFNTRRAFVARSVEAAVAGVTLSPSLPVQAASGVDYRAVSSDIAKLIESNKDCGPTIVRLAWHSSGTYDKISKTGGSNGGTIRFKEELDHGGNVGLADTVKLLEPIHEKYAADGLSYGDLYTLAGVTAIKTLGGPAIPWSAGRVDALDPSAVTPDGRLPAADSGPDGADESDSDHLRTIFGRMGFNDQEIVALSGAHALGRCHPDASGYEGPWTALPTQFSNFYFVALQSLEWTPREWEGPYQYINPPNTNGFLMMLPTDLVLIEDDSFNNWVSRYAANKDLFYNDFTAAFQKLEELGTKGLTSVTWTDGLPAKKGGGLFGLFA